MIIVSRIIHVKGDRKLNVTNKFKYQRRLSSRLAIVMFRGTPCTIKNSRYLSSRIVWLLFQKSYAWLPTHDAVSIKTPFFNFELCTLQKRGSAGSSGRRVLIIP